MKRRPKQNNSKGAQNTFTFKRGAQLENGRETPS